MWVARLLGNFLNGMEKARVDHKELKRKGMLDNLADYFIGNGYLFSAEGY
jgi:hypothetical protein